MLEFMDVAYDVPRKSEEFANDAIDFIANPTNEKISKIHSRCQKQHEKFNSEGSSKNIDSQVNLVNYFSMIAKIG